MRVMRQLSATGVVVSLIVLLSSPHTPGSDLLAFASLVLTFGIALKVWRLV